MNLMETLKNKFNDMALPRKISLVFSVGIFILSLIFNIQLDNLIKAYDHEIYMGNTKHLNDVIFKIEAQMTSFEEMSNYILATDDIQDGLKFLLDHPDDIKRPQESQVVYDALYDFFFSSDYIQSIALVQEDDIINMGATLDLENFDTGLVQEQLADHQGTILWITDEEDPSSIYLIRRIPQLRYLTLRHLATLYIKIDLNSLIDNALIGSGYATEQSDFFLYDGQRLLFPVDQLSPPTELPPVNEEATYTIQSFNGDKQFIIANHMSKVPWHYYYLRDYNSLFTHLIRIKWISFLVTIISAFSILLITNWIISNLFRHLKFLVRKIKDFGQGISPSMENSIYADRKDEIGSLHRHFDDMTQSVKVLRDANYEKQLYLKDAHLQMLEHQINPHFLYNTLDMINWMAQVNDNMEISEVVLALGKLFRASIADSHDLIRLEQELSFLDNYIQIQKVRFNERLNFTNAIPETYNNVFIPRLSLQPLVENALKHAMESIVDNCYIELSVDETETDYVFDVANTGSYFEDDLLVRLHTNDIKPTGTGVGLYNIESRLKLLFGEQYGLSFRNDNKRAIVSLRVPKEASQKTYNKPVFSNLKDPMANG